MIYRFVDAEIARRKASGQRGDDLLSRLLSASENDADGEGLNDQQVRDEALTMFFASHHTIAATLAWTLYLLSQVPQQQMLVRDEARSLSASLSASQGEIPVMPYTEMVLKESMRIYPPAWSLFARYAVQDVELGDCHVPADSWLFIYPWVVHRDPRFFPDPLRFDPLRFSPEREKQIPTGAYIPFGLGPHMCPGNRIGMSVLQTVLAMVLLRYEVQLASHSCLPRPQPMISIRPRPDIRIRLLPCNARATSSPT
jgi:cytochrome P450